MLQKIEALVVRVGLPTTRLTILNDLPTLQAIVGGPIQCVPLEPNVVLICHEEGKLQNLPANRYYKGDTIHGDFLVCGTAQEEFYSLSENGFKQYSEFFNRETVRHEGFFDPSKT
jgi:Domain of unknown function (DUF3846)